MTIDRIVLAVAGTMILISLLREHYLILPKMDEN